MITVRNKAIRIGTIVVALTLAGSVSNLVLPPAGATAQDFSPMSTFNGLACATASQCIGVGNATSGTGSGAAATLDPLSGDLSAGQAVQLIGSSELLNGVSCPSSAACLAVGEGPNESEGIAVPLNPATGTLLNGQSLHSISGIFMFAVACASSTQCLAVGHGPSGSGEVVALDPATGAISNGQSVQTITGTGGVGLEGVTCPSTNLCVAVGENSGQSAGVAVPLDPTTGAVLSGQNVQSVTTKGILIDVACPSTTQCLAVGWGASQPSVAVPIDAQTGALSSGQDAQSISTRAAMLTGVICPSTSLCLAVGNDAGDPSHGQAVPLSPTTGSIGAGQSIQTLAGTGALNAVACPTATQCLAAGSSFESAGAVTDILNPVTGSTTVVPATPTTTPGVVSPASSPGTTPSGPVLAFTGLAISPLLTLGASLVLSGTILVGASARTRRKRLLALR